MDIPQKDIVFRTINAAIGGQQVVQFKLKNTWRTVEPYLVGLHRATRKPVLYGYGRDIVSGYMTPSRWEIFHLNEIEAIELTSYSFLAHIDYTGQMESVQPIYRRIKPLFNEMTPGHWSIRTRHCSTKKIDYPDKR